MPTGVRSLPGIFPPGPIGIDAAVRRVLLALMFVLALGGLTVYLVFSRDPELAAVIAVAVLGCVAAAAIPWHRYDRDAFGSVGVALTAWVAWIISRTGGADSPHVPLAFLAVAICAVPLSRRNGTILAVAAALEFDQRRSGKGRAVTQGVLAQIGDDLIKLIRVHA